MKLYEFVDKFYEMGDMEAPKTVRSKKTLNESYTVSDELFDEYKSDDFKDVGDIHNEIMFNYGDKDLADDVVSRIEVYRNNRDDDDDYYDDDDLDEGLDAGALSESLKPEDLVPGEVYNHKTIPYMDKDEAEEYPEEFEEVKAALVLRKGVYCVPRRYELKYVGTENQTPGWNSALIFDVMGTELSFNTDVLNYIEF